MMNEEMMSAASAGLTVSERMKSDLLSAAKWAKFLCIIGTIGMVLMVVIAILMMAFSATLSSVIPNMPFGAFMGFFYLIIAAIYVYPIIKGFQFANGTKAACLTNDENELARGFEGLRALFQFMGVLTIIVLALYALIVLGAIVVALIVK
ncbi:MAG: hypothetical protein IJV20_08240 [Prevotella sp.]|nr:hypothetical protein [Prevotella sp.]